ncbi:hypothetical protein TSACC_3662 [Terrimicrobium sacchariphilum]|uniref:Toxin-antitoxin system HicB family antitoxin n=1 Tax=Terrimicrobium sacchariphilum TaxID=690879 RepID=A0A146GE38_TERSA|nr:hypothetical protein [Terrimicrobium sacchariphilum]GAT35591.1 hypothetical protein TSACC_3662 [Terrimicrobium sacchariphilum]
MKTKQTAIRLPDDLKSAAEKKAKSDQRSLASYIKSLIARDLGWTIEQLEKSGEADLAKAANLKKQASRKK